MMPATPRSHLILRQARFPLGSSKTLFHPNLRQARGRTPAVASRTVRSTSHNRASRLFGLVVREKSPTSLRDPCDAHASFAREPSKLRWPGPLLARPNLDATPLLRGFHPFVLALKRNFRRRTRTAVRRRNSVQIADTIRRNSQKILLVHGRNSSRKPLFRPISSSPVTQVCGNIARWLRIISIASSCRVRNLISRGIPACRQRRLSFVHSLGSTTSHRPMPVRRERRRPYRRRPGSCPPFPLARTTAAPCRPTPCLA